jgi:hypothetical protein
MDFTYDNAELIHMLKERGELIKAEKWDRVTKIELEIDHLKSKELGKLTRPISVFVTFENEEGYHRAIKLSEFTEIAQFLPD